MKLLIVGGVAGGASAAARARRLSEDAEIVLFERGAEPSFANCGMPYYLGGEIKERGKLLVAPVERLRQRYRLDVRLRCEVTSIDRARKVARVHDLATNRHYEERYDKLILAPGAAPLRPALPGLDLPGIFTLRDLADMDRVAERLRQGARQALVVGAGFIGLEMAENLTRRGLQVTLVELQDQVLPPLDRELTTPLADHLRSHGVELVLSDSVESFSPWAEGVQAKLKSGRVVAAHAVILSVGVRPENRLAVDAGLAVGPRGGIQVNAHMQTSDPDVYAVGDAIEVLEYVSRQPAQIPLAGPANRQGRVAADHAFGRHSAFRGAQGTAIVGVFGMTAALTGLGEKALQRMKLPYLKAYVHPSHHAGYYPGAEQMTLKLLFEPGTGRVLGAQAVGGAGVDKRIDVLAVAVQARFTVFDLEELELAYAPQYGSAKDPVNMLGFVAAGLLRGDHPQTAAEQIAAAGDAWLLDVRTPGEFSQGHVPGAVNIPIDELRARLGELPRDRPIIAYCQVGMRGYLATRLLRQKGFAASNLGGGYRTYRQVHP